MSGILSAARVDFDAFKKWNKWRDARDYDWSLATFRWAQGALIGLGSAGSVLLVKYGISL